MPHQVPKEFKYTKDHEWVKIEGEMAIVGITDFAQSALGDIVFAELPEVGAEVEKEKAFGVVESVKSVSDLYAPLSGEVTEINGALESGPEKINESPYESWMIKIKVRDKAQVQDLLDPPGYESHCDGS